MGRAKSFIREKSDHPGMDKNELHLNSNQHIPELRVNDTRLDSESTKMDFDLESDEESNRLDLNFPTRPASQQSNHKQGSKSVPTDSIELKDQTDYIKYLATDWGRVLSKSRRPSNISESGSTRLRLKQGYLPEQSERFCYRYVYLKMIFDPKLWEEEAIAIMASTIASLYATILICVYICFIFTEMFRFPHYKDYLENQGFFIHLFLIADLYFIFVIYRVIAVNLRSKQIQLHENDRSHATLTVRLGAVIFGSVSLAYFLMRLVKFFEMDKRAPFPCYEKLKGVNYFLMCIFVILQAVVIFTFPRLNFLTHQIINRYGTMHVAATNIILWIRTLVKETLEEITEVEEEHLHKIERQQEYDLEHGHETGASPGHEQVGTECDIFFTLKNYSDHFDEKCQEFHTKILGDAVNNSSPYLYPFIIEFVLIGASVAYIMSNHIGKRPERASMEVNKIQSPNAIEFLKKKDLSHSLKGLIAGFLIVAIAVINLGLFYGLYVKGENEDDAEFWSKVCGTVVNLIAIVALVIGIAETQQLDFRNPNHKHITVEMDLDLILLRFTSVFVFLYMIFTVITAAFTENMTHFHTISIVSGLAAILEVTMQIAFIYNLKYRTLPKDKEYSKPGRQMTVFFFMFNAAQWLVFTFEVQKAKANVLESDFFGFMPWVIIQRVTLPLTVFFYFHSAVVFIELFKEVFADEEEPTEGIPNLAFSSSKEELKEDRL